MMVLHFKSSINGCFFNWLKRALATQASSQIKTIRVVDRKGGHKSFDVRNHNGYIQLLKIVGAPGLRTEDSKYVLDFRDLQDAQTYHLALEDDQSSNKLVTQLSRELCNQHGSREQAVRRHIYCSAKENFELAFVEELPIRLFHNAAGDTILEIDAGVIVHFQRGGKHLILGEHKATLTTENAREILSKRDKIWRTLQQPREQAPEVHEVFGSLAMQEVVIATLVVAGDQIIPTGDQSLKSAQEELLNSYDQVLTLSGNMYKAIT